MCAREGEKAMFSPDILIKFMANKISRSSFSERKANASKKRVHTDCSGTQETFSFKQNALNL
jgi:hypothetical protein